MVLELDLTILLVEQEEEDERRRDPTEVAVNFDGGGDLRQWLALFRFDRRRRTSEKKMEYHREEEVVDLESFSIMALSPLDGRYLQKVKDLYPFFSEYGLICYRIMVKMEHHHEEEVVDLESFSIMALSPLDGRYL
ncbi:uncharacterized protein A4U43_C06F8580 [Asparagus officinalis]|uniref:Adenylosuccinate lyase n=1 Tax=Asparagus officinalis TaxID=4686 RepID=A0A5P1EMT5_ASPOF|nr:uncharacterized protein A4U43_C06F8580 [Asparagus officinalis]